MIIPLRVESYQLELLPTPLYDVLDAQVELAAHDARVRLVRELVEEVDGDAVDFVVHVKAVAGWQVSLRSCANSRLREDGYRTI